MDPPQETDYAFISVGKTGKPQGRDRKLIRSRCMKGKNLRIGVHMVPTDDDLNPIGHVAWRHFEGPSRNERIYSALSPEPPWAQELDTYSRRLVFDFSNRVEEILYPVRPCVDFGSNRRFWFLWLTQDATYVHPVLFSVYVIDSIIRQTPLASQTSFHLGKSLAFVNERLSDRTLCLDDSTFWIVVSLIVFSSCLSDPMTAAVHMRGLGELLRLRGGLKSFRHSARLYTKLCRLDLAYCLHYGEDPFFSTETEPWHPSPDASDSWNLADSSLPRLPEPVVDLQNPELAAAFRDLQRLTHILNAETSTSHHQRLAGTEFQDRICAVQYRLLWLRGRLESIFAECLRLAMLAFLATTLRQPGSLVRHAHLAARFQECCVALEISTQPHLRDLMLWVLAVGAVSLVGAAEPWLRERWRAEVSPQMTWEEARQRLQGIMWIGAIHDQAGRQAFWLL